MKVYQEWAEFRNSQPETGSDPLGPVPLHFIDVPVERISHWLSRFVVEARRADGKPYPPNTLHNIVSAIQRYYTEEEDQADFGFLHRHNVKYASFRNTLDGVMKKLTAEGHGSIKSYDAVTADDEAQMWEKNVFDLNTAHGLSYAAFFYVAKVFGLRGASEHHQLMAEQFTFCRDNQGNYVQFEERRVKTNQGGLSRKRFQPRTVAHYEIDSPVCVYRILLRYLSYINFSGNFYQRPIRTTNGEIKFANAPIGRNTLGKYMKTIFDLAEIPLNGRRISNHSARVGTVTTLMNAGHDNFDIQERSGHRSDVLNRYKRPSAKRKFEISQKLDVTPKKKSREVTPTPAQNDACDDVTQKAARRDAGHEDTCANKLRVEVSPCTDFIEVIKNGQMFSFRL